MILYINTADKEKVSLALWEEKLSSNKKVEYVEVLRQDFLASRAQAEKLLPAIEKILQKGRIKLKDLNKIIVADFGGSFTSLRIGIATANALAYALNIPVEAETKGAALKVGAGIKIVAPRYNREPNIG